MNKMLKFVLCILLTFGFWTLATSAESSGTFSWYCKRNTEHRQPEIDSEMRFIEDYNGYYVDKKCVENNEKVVYLTFDVGYENGNVEKIMDILRDEKINGSFFILENVLLKNTDLVKRMVNEGDLVCNHTANHNDISEMSLEELKIELETMEKLFKEKIGREMPKYFRPPEGKFSLDSMKYASELGYKTVFWSFAYADWDNNNQMSYEKAMEKVMSNTHNGAIMLFHPTSETNVKILPNVIKALKKQGYRFKTLEHL